jgi:hypothetical protein
MARGAVACAAPYSARPAPRAALSSKYLRACRRNDTCAAAGGRVCGPMGNGQPDSQPRTKARLNDKGEAGLLYDATRGLRCGKGGGQPRTRAPLFGANATAPWQRLCRARQSGAARVREAGTAAAVALGARLPACSAGRTQLSSGPS